MTIKHKATYTAIISALSEDRQEAIVVLANTCAAVVISTGTDPKEFTARFLVDYLTMLTQELKEGGRR